MKNDKYIYELIEEKNIKIIKYIGNETDVKIPKEINGMSVIDIADGAFKDCKNLRNIDLTDISTIYCKMGQLANYFDCSILESVILPYGWFKNEKAFEGCINLKFIEFSEYNEFADHCNLDMLNDCVNLEECSIHNYPSCYMTFYKMLRNKEKFKCIKIYDKGICKEYDFNSFKEIVFNPNTYSNCNLPHDKFSDCPELETFTLSDWHDTLEKEEFKNCVNLKSIKIARGCCEIEDSVFEGCNNLEKISIPSKVYNIGSRVFYNCINLKSVKFSNSFPEYSDDLFGEYCFCGCKSLESIIIPRDIKIIAKGTFKDCSSLKEIVLSDNTKEIGDEAFCNCTELESIALPDTITKIGESAFKNCTNFKTITISPYVTTIGKDAFKGCKNLTINYSKSSTCWNKIYQSNDSSELNIVFGEKDFDENEVNSYLDFVLSEDGLSYDVKWNGNFGSNISELVIPSFYEGKPVLGICDSGFTGCEYIKSIVISEGVKSIRPNSFSKCPNLESIILSDTIEKIGEYAFRGCPNLESIILPNSVKEIGEYAFYSCSTLKTIKLSNSLKNIPKCFFEYCKKLESIILPNSIEKIGESAFSDCTSLESIILPDSVKEVGDYAFNSCNKLKSINLPDSIISIGGAAFWQASSLENLILPKKLKKIENFTFHECISLKKILIPEGVEEIGYGAFKSCINLETIYIPNSVKIFGENIFKDCKNLKEIKFNIIDKYNCDYYIESNTLIKNEKLKNNKISKIVVAGCCESIIPEGVNKIEKEAFYGVGIKRIVIPDSVSKLEKGTFAHCYQLEYIKISNKVKKIPAWFCDGRHLKFIVIPKSVKTIEDNGIELPEYEIDLKLESIFYQGTQAEWNEIKKEINYSKYVCFYSENEPTDKNYKYWRYVNEEPRLW